MKVKEIRQSKNLSQKELSDIVGITQGGISHIETGIRKPSLPIAQALAKALECTIEDLFENKEDTEQDGQNEYC